MARDKGTGGLSYDAKRDRWIGTIETGWTTKGGRRRVKVSAKTKREALQKLRAKQRDIAMQGVPSPSEQRAQTIKGFSDEWLELQKARLSPSAYTANRIAIQKWVIPTIGRRRLEQVSAADVRRVANEIIKAGNTPSTALRYQQVLVKMLKDAVRDGLAVPQAALMVETVSANKPDREAIPLSDAKAILEAARSEPDYSRWLAAFMAALRPAEARGLTWDRVDFDRYALEISWQMKPLPYQVPRDRKSGFRVPVGYESIQVVDAFHLVRPKTKSGDRWIPMVPPLRDALLEWREKCPGDYGLVWPNLTGKQAATIGRPREDKVDRAVWKSLCERADAYKNDGRAYDLYEARHTAATMLREAGASDEVITLIMGHSTILSTKAYVHVSMERASKSLGVVSDLLLEGKRKGH